MLRKPAERLWKSRGETVRGSSARILPKSGDIVDTGQMATQCPQWIQVFAMTPDAISMADEGQSFTHFMHCVQFSKWMVGIENDFCCSKVNKKAVGKIFILHFP